jgi:hypothetical protein
MSYFVGVVFKADSGQNTGARGGAVVEALRYKPEGRGIDCRGCHWNILLT